MTDETLSQFKNELNSFFVLFILNVVFGALAIAFGMQFMIASVMGLAEGEILIRVLTGAISLAVFGLGLSWVLSSVKVLEGTTEIRREYSEYKGPVPDEILTGWIVRLTAHYRKNRETIHRMTIICALGGCAFLAIGVLNLIQGITWTADANASWIQGLPFIAAGINITIGLASLLFCGYFRRYSAAWDLRLDETARSETILERTLERQ
ncbi:MAG TPA: hypothetical protein VFG36_01285 [Methanoregula sp.]|nr:hypothetical protein [Methanoregula sp.]